MKILAIDTSCDETAVAVTEGQVIASNVIWSQASLHADFGGVMPSLAQRQHEERIDWVVNRALRQAQCRPVDLGSVAVTAGPGLGIALGVGIAKAKELAKKWNKPLIAVNHIEGHVLGVLAETNSKSQVARSNITLPCMALVVSGGHTELILVEQIGRYKIIARTRDDALGEALDKAARMLALGYPGGAILEKMAKTGNAKTYPLPLPMARREDEKAFSYSGLKTAFWRMTDKKHFSKQEIADLAASFQNRAFEHLTRISRRVMADYPTADLLVGGGVAANMELRKRLRSLGKEMGVKMHFPYSLKLCGDNAAMIGVAAGFKAQRGEFSNPDKIDRLPRWRVDEAMSGILWYNLPVMIRPVTGPFGKLRAAEGRREERSKA